MGSVITRLLATQAQYVDLATNQVISGTKIFQDARGSSNPALEGYASGIETMRRQMTTGTATNVLTDNLYIYVNPNAAYGSDSNPGTSGSPVQTIDKALQILQTYDLDKYKATVKLCDGTYVLGAGGSVLGVNLPAYRGLYCATNYLSGCAVIEGNVNNPERVNVVVSGSTDSAGFQSTSYCPWLLKDFVLTMLARGSGWGVGIYAPGPRASVYYNNIIFAGNHGYCFWAAAQSTIAPMTTELSRRINMTGKNYSCLGRCQVQSSISIASTAINFDVANTAFSASFVAAEQLAEIDALNATFTGNYATVTGSRYAVSLGGFIYTNTNNTSFFPGNAAGTDTFHQQYY